MPCRIREAWLFLAAWSDTMSCVADLGSFFSSRYSYFGGVLIHTLPGMWLAIN